MNKIRITAIALLGALTLVLASCSSGVDGATTCNQIVAASGTNVTHAQGFAQLQQVIDNASSGPLKDDLLRFQAAAVRYYSQGDSSLANQAAIQSASDDMVSICAGYGVYIPQG